MGRRRGRKQSRKREFRERRERFDRRRDRERRPAADEPAVFADQYAAVFDEPRGPRSLLALLDEDDGGRAAPKLTCEGCHEFVPNDESGRGTCLHPGSGVLSPWTDTPACDFYEGRRRR